SDANKVTNDQKRCIEKPDEQKTGPISKVNSDENQSSGAKLQNDAPKETRTNQPKVMENANNSTKIPEWLELEDDEVFEAASKPTKSNHSVTSVGATNSNQINPISVPKDTKDTTCAEPTESKQTTRTTPDKFAPTYPNGNEYVQPSSLVIQSPTQHQTRLFEPTTNDAECKKITPMDQQPNRQNDDDGSRNVDTTNDAESGTEEKIKEEVVILSTEKSSNFSKTASIVSDVHVVAGDTVNRNQQTETKKSPSAVTTSEITSSSVTPLFDSSDLPDFPLPDLPVTSKSQPPQTIPVADYHHSLPTSYKTKQRSLDKLKQFPLQRTSTDNMLSRRLPNRRESDQYMSFNDDMPKYLFGDRMAPGTSQKSIRPDEKIFLNKSGWVQVNQRRADKSPVRSGRRHSKTNVHDDVRSSNLNRFNSLDRSENFSYHQPSHKFSKIEELISRDEARSINVTLKKFELDPRISALLNDRPGFLPITRVGGNESPPPPTPIISPPPAFQDTKSSKPKSSEMISKIHLTVNNKINSDKTNTGTNKKNVSQNSHNNNSNKGMVFSRSFEYDNREPRQYNEIFSKSFDYDFKTPFTEDKRTSKEKTKAFTTLTGVSPNYLTKKERSLENSRDNSPQHHQYLEPLPIVRQIKQKSHVRTTLSIRPEKFRSVDEEKGRSRRAQFTKTNIENSITGIGQGFRSFDASLAINKRLNSCDSGARSDLSNDEIDSDNYSNRQRSNYLFSQSRHTQSVIKKQRSLTPDKSSDEQSQMSKQRYNNNNNTEKRITKNSSVESQGSVYLKSSSSSRSSILDRQRFEDNKFVSSRSSSTSSFSGGEHEPMNFSRSRYRQLDPQLSDGSRIRRSRSLQLTERSPSRSKNSLKLTSGQPNPSQNIKYAQPQRERANKRSEQVAHDKQHSFEAEYNKFQYNSKLDFDKSRSFDEDYCNDQSRPSKFINENRSLSNDRVFSSNTSNAPAKIKQNMTQNYGTRLYDHEMMYDMARKVMDRSPIMEFNDRKHDPIRGRERSPNSSNEHLMSHRNSKNQYYEKDHFGASPGNMSPNEYRNRSSPGSEIDIVHDYDMKYKSDVLDSELIKEAKLVTEFLYGNRTKAEILLNQRRKEQKQLNQRPGTMSSSGRLNHKPTNKCLMEDREMPITRERVGLKLEHKNGLRMRDSSGSVLSPDPSQLRSPNSNKYSRTSLPTNLGSKLRSVSLPKIVPGDESTNDEDFRSFGSFTIAKSKNSMRAVSCPSIIENHLEQVQVPAVSRNDKSSTGRVAKPEDVQHQNRQVDSVFQKLKNTFSNLKGKNLQNVEYTVADADSVYHFGPLKWRSSKERRKVKQLRRDKCNSGDSGIHVEQDNDSEGNENIPPMSIKRINSAKDQKIKEMKKNRSDRKHLRNFKDKSASQPNGLNTLYRGNDAVNLCPDVFKIGSILDQCETDSLTSDHNIQEIVYAEVLFPFQPVGDQELALEKGALVEVIRRDPGPWWWGKIKHDKVVASIMSEPLQGWFPKDFVRVIPSLLDNTGNHLESPKASLTEEPNSDQLEFAEAFNSAVNASPSKGSQSSKVIRDNVVKELLETEIKYVNLLSSLCNGFLNVLRLKGNIFPADSLSLIFSNIEQIWHFQQTFLNALRIAVQENRIAETFIEFQSAFMVYSIYCNSYSRALMELENLTENEEALSILENCRIAQNLPELPLSAHLLAPIQRLCRYPLHLGELVKFTPVKQDILKQQPSLIDITKLETETIDCKETLELALGAMKRVTEMVNEGKRHSEYLFRIQSRIDDFQGPAISLHSTRLFLQSDAIHMTPNIWNNTYTLFLFDHQIIYCKKDLLKRTQYIYKGRIFLDNCRILNLPDGKMFGVTLKNALRLYCATRNKWLDFCFRSSSSKLRFLNTLSAERQFCGQNLFISELAGEDDNDGMLTDEDAISDHVEYVELNNEMIVERPKGSASNIG
ncbi:Rho guanine nucleotide exchange factor 4, partial [Pseudolycoriella hygida]